MLIIVIVIINASGTNEALFNWTIIAEWSVEVVFNP